MWFRSDIFPSHRVILLFGFIFIIIILMTVSALGSYNTINISGTKVDKINSVHNKNMTVNKTTLSNITGIQDCRSPNTTRTTTRSHRNMTYNTIMTTEKTLLSTRGTGTTVSERMQESSGNGGNTQSLATTIQSQEPGTSTTDSNSPHLTVTQPSESPSESGSSSGNINSGSLNSINQWSLNSPSSHQTLGQLAQNQPVVPNTNTLPSGIPPSLPPEEALTTTSSSGSGYTMLIPGGSGSIYSGRRLLGL